MLQIKCSNGIVKDLNLQKGMKCSHLQSRNLVNFKFAFNLKMACVSFLVEVT